jgi:hypothetical protein
MTDTTPAPAATPEAQAADGQQTELEQTNSEHAQALSPEQLRAELDAARKEAASYRTKLRQTEKQATDAEAKRLAEQGEYRTLYESVKAKADERDALQERLDAITAQAQAANERRIAAIPEAMKSLVPEYDDPLEVMKWLSDVRAFCRKSGRWLCRVTRGRLSARARWALPLRRAKSSAFRLTANGTRRTHRRCNCSAV